MENETCAICRNPITGIDWNTRQAHGSWEKRLLPRGVTIGVLCPDGDDVIIHLHDEKWRFAREGPE